MTKTLVVSHVIPPDTPLGIEMEPSRRAAAHQPFNARRNVSRGTGEQQLQRLDTHIQSMHSQVALEQTAEELVPRTKALSRMSSASRAHIDSLLDEVAVHVDRKAVRVQDPDIRNALIQKDKRRARRGGSITASLYRNAGGMPSWSTIQASASGRAPQPNMCIASHPHGTPHTFITDVRCAIGASLDQPLPPSVQSDVALLYACLTPSGKRGARTLDTHNSFCRFVAGQRRVGGTRSLATIVDTIGRDVNILVHGVLLRHDATVDVVVSLDLYATFFGVLRFTAQDLQTTAEASHSHTPSVRHQIVNELHGAATKNRKDRAADQDKSKRHTLGTLATRYYKKQETEFYNRGRHIYHSFPQDGGSNATLDQRLLGRSAQLFVREPHHSPLLSKKLMLEFRFGYICTCQCLVPDTALTRYKHTMAQFSRAERQKFPSNAKKVTNGSSETISMPPIYDSDSESTSSKHPQAGTRRSQAPRSASILAESTVPAPTSRSRRRVAMNSTPMQQLAAQTGMNSSVPLAFKRKRPEAPV